MKTAVSACTKVFIASFETSCLIDKNKRAYTVGEALLQPPAILKRGETYFEAATAHIVRRRIESVLTDIKEHLLTCIYE
jgi:hypothetical protein